MDPEHASARLLRVHALMQLGRLSEALDELDILISRGVKHVEALQLKADIFVRLSRLDEGIELYRAALNAAPKDPLVSYKLSQALLLKGDIEGFHRYFDKRRELTTFIDKNKDYPFHDWNGELSIEGRLLVWSEHGLCLGQTIMHLGFLRSLTALGLSVVVQVTPTLVNICRRSFPDCTIVTNEDKLPSGISHHIPVASMSRWFKSDLASFSAMQPYLVPDVQLVAAHRDRLQHAANGQLLVGVCWTDCSDGDVELVRLDQLLAAVAAPGVALVNLQGASSPPSAVAEAGAEKRLMDSGIDHEDVDQIAAIVAAMNMVVSVDHPTVHIAGAIGTPTYVLLPPVPAAHWLADGERAIWYPATKLLRQKPLDRSWETVLINLEHAVRDFVNSNEPGSWLAGTSIPALQAASAARGTMLRREISEAVRASLVQGEGAFDPALEQSGGSQLQNLEDLPIAVDPADIEAAMSPFLDSEADDRRWNEWHGKIWRHTVDRLVSGREANRDRSLVERDYSVWGTMGYDRYRLDRNDLQGTPWSWRGRRLALDGAAAARLRTVLFSAVLRELRPRRVLEVGSGNGINLLSLAGAFPETEFTGLELTPEGVQQARMAQSNSAIAEIIHTYSPADVVDRRAIERIHFLQGDASTMPFEDDSFDLVMTVLAVEQMESIRSAALSEISRVTCRHVLMLEPFRDMNERGLKRLYVQSRGYFRGSIGELRGFGLEPLWATADFPQETFLGTALVLAARSPEAR
jgi:SAM-dependent methyltransferase/tetratricopeptide (TPR) repeat protein